MSAPRLRSAPSGLVVLAFFASPALADNPNLSVVDDFTDVSWIDDAASDPFRVVAGRLTLPSTVVTGDGSDGPCSVTTGTLDLTQASCVGRATADAPIWHVAAPITTGEVSIPVDGPLVGLAAGDEVFVLAVTGASAGAWEERSVVGVSGSTISLGEGLVHAYSGSGGGIIVQRVPHYSSMVVDVGATVTVSPWNGAVGGTLPLRVAGDVLIAGTLSLSSSGFRGAPELPSWGGGYCGEGAAVAVGSTRAPSCSQGSGGGGDAEWCHSGQGGAGGGHGSNGLPGGAAFFSCGGGWAFGGVVSVGGGSIGEAELSTLRLGPGGGGGGVDGDNPEWGGSGGRGAGVLLLRAVAVTVAGSVQAQGGQGGYGVAETGGGGGGAGGAIRIEATDLTISGTLLAQGGPGGTADRPQHPGGAGGPGRIRLLVANLSGSSSPSASVAAAPYPASATVTSTDLLLGSADIGSVDGFQLADVTLPLGTAVSIQWSGDGSSWSDAVGVLDASTALVAGDNDFDLDDIGLSGPSLFYRILAVTDGSGAPSIDTISVDACADPVDSDGDGAGDLCEDDDDDDLVPDDSDLCPLLADPIQGDLDSDLIGDLCDPDRDGDGVDDPIDLCPEFADPLQMDLDEDGIGDLCDEDADGDDVVDSLDLCPGTFDPAQDDLDGDGAGDLCDFDADGDDVDDTLDRCPGLPDPLQGDLDGDLLGDLCDDDADGDAAVTGADCDDLDASVWELLQVYGDTDGDGWGEIALAEWVCAATPPSGTSAVAGDDCPQVWNPAQLDFDGDGSGDACDADADGDGAADDCDDLDPSVSSPFVLFADVDGDGIGDGAAAVILCGEAPPDLVASFWDNCPALSNPGQEDGDGDGLGDACDADADGDLVQDDVDNCPEITDPSVADLDSDGLGDPCDPDSDGDGSDAGVDCDDGDATIGAPLALWVDGDGDGWGDPAAPVLSCGDWPVPLAAEGSDNCPLLHNAAQEDSDGDELGDVCDADQDGDGWEIADNCPAVANPGQEDGDGDGIGDACTGDEDGDGIGDGADLCPLIADVGQEDLDGDGWGDACDPDVDGDGYGGAVDCDDQDALAALWEDGWEDTDGDGYGDPDQPGLFCGSLPPGQVPNDEDNCPSVDDPDLSDQDGDGLGPGCDPDEDGDGVADWLDLCPWIADPLQRDLDGDGTGDLCEDDADGDGVDDAIDHCPAVVDPGNTDLDADGLGDACDDDRDGDGADRITDCDDLDALHQEFGHFFADLDGDGLGDPHVDLWACLDVPPPGWVADQRDTCPEDAGADPQDSDQDGLGDACDVEDGGCVCQSGATGPAGMLLVLPLGWVIWGRRRTSFLRQRQVGPSPSRPPGCCGRAS